MSPYRKEHPPGQDTWQVFGASDEAGKILDDCLATVQTETLADVLIDALEGRLSITRMADLEEDNEALAENLHAAILAACDACAWIESIHGLGELDDQTNGWWCQHKQSPGHKKMLEDLAAARQAALAKLTDEDLTALGLTRASET